MNEEKISVIIVTYNNEKYIERCLDSVLNQSYKNIKVIVVDDGSTDRTDIILKNYKNKINVYKKKNGGVASARNLGIKMCDTKYFMFVDSDDYIEPKAIEEMYKTLITTNSDIVIGNIENSDIKDITIEDEKYEYIFNGKIKYFMVMWNKLMKKETFENLTFPNIHIAEDEYMIYHILERVKKITYIGKKTYNYCINSKGLSSKSLNYYKEILEVFRDRYIFFKKTKYNNIFYKLYMNYYIFFYCQFKDKNITKNDLVKKFRSELKYKSNIKYLFFYICPNIYYNLFKIRRRLWKIKYQ